MGILTKKIKGNKPYWYYVESGRIDGKPRITRQVYLGTAESIVKEVEENKRPMPIGATARAWGLPIALWKAALNSGIWDCLQARWPPKRKRPSIAHYFILAAIHRICDPGPKTEIQEWYKHSPFHTLWKFKPSRFTSQDFWDAFNEINLDLPFPDDDLSQIQLRILQHWKKSHQVSQCLLAYDSTNFYTYIDSKNERCQLAKRGINKQKQNNLKQVGLSYILDAHSGMGIYNHTYPGNVNDAIEFSTSLPRIIEFLDRTQIPRSQVSLVFDKGVTDLANILEVEQKEMGWIGAVPWNHVPRTFRETPYEKLLPCSSQFPGVRAYAEKVVVEGHEKLCVIQHSAVFASEQLHSFMANVAKAVSKLKTLTRELLQPKKRPSKKETIEKRITTINASQWLKNVIMIDELTKNANDTWSLQFHVSQEELCGLINKRFGRTIIATNRMHWNVEQVVNAYNGQSKIERKFRALKNGEGPSWWPIYHWTDDKIIIHSAYCTIGLSLLNHLYRKTKDANLQITLERMVEELDKLEEIIIAYPRKGKRGPYPTVSIDTRETLDQMQLIKLFELEEFHTKTKG